MFLKKLLSLSETSKIDRVQKKRKTMEYADKIMQGRAGLTIESLEITNKALKNLNFLGGSFA